jgi:hypothetical protein
MSRMKDLYENIWYCFVEQGMTPHEIANQYNCPIDWVTSALDIAEEDEHYDNICGQTIH